MNAKQHIRLISQSKSIKNYCSPLCVPLQIPHVLRAELLKLDPSIASATERIVFGMNATSRTFPEGRYRQCPASIYPVCRRVLGRSNAVSDGNVVMWAGQWRCFPDIPRLHKTLMCSGRDSGWINCERLQNGAAYPASRFAMASAKARMRSPSLTMAISIIRPLKDTAPFPDRSAS